MDSHVSELEDIMYEDFAEAVDAKVDDPAEMPSYSRDDYIENLQGRVSVEDPAEFANRPFHELEGQVFVDEDGYSPGTETAAYALVDDRGDQVAMKVVMIGDSEAVRGYLEEQPEGEHDPDLDSVDEPFKSAGQRAPEHVLEGAGETDFQDPQETQVHPFYHNNSAGRIVEEVRED